MRKILMALSLLASLPIVAAAATVSAASAPPGGGGSSGGGGGNCGATGLEVALLGLLLVLKRGRRR